MPIPAGCWAGFIRLGNCLEVTTHEPLTDKMVLQFYELPKLSPLAITDRGRDLWLKLFNAETEEELKQIEEMGMPIMSEAVVAYRHVAASDEFKEIERMRSKARHDEAQVLKNAQRKRDEQWRSVVAGKDAMIAEVVAEKVAAIAENEKLRAQLAELRSRQGYGENELN